MLGGPWCRVQDVFGLVQTKLSDRRPLACGGSGGLPVHFILPVLLFVFRAEDDGKYFS